METNNPCPNQRTITRPLLFVHNYSLFFFGSILNILAFFILIKRSLRCHSTFAYLAFLSLSNGLLCLVRFSQWMFAFHLRIQLENSLLPCRICHFSLDFLTHFSLFTLVCVNIDRARTVRKHRPSSKFPRSTFHTVLITEFVIALILGCYHSHWLIKFGYEVNDGPEKRTICDLNPKQTSTVYFYFLSTVYPLFELIIIFCLPLLINIICTMIIVRSLHLRMRTAKRFAPTSETNCDVNKRSILSRTKSFFASITSCLIPRQTSKSNIYSCFCFQIQCRRHTQMRLQFTRNHQSLIKYEGEQDSTERQTSSNTSNGGVPADAPPMNVITATILNKKQQHRRTRDKHLSAMLIVLNILYFFLNLPFNFHQTFGRTLYKNASDDCLMRFTHVLLDILQQTYFSTNFFLYVLTNRRFREEFYKTVRRVISRTGRYRPGSHHHHYRQTQRSESLNQSTMMMTQCQGDFQTIQIPSNQQRDSYISDIELTEVPVFSQQQQQQQQQIVIADEKNRLVSKLIFFKELSSEKN